MSHSPTTRAIDRYANDSIKQKDPLVFLREFGPLHKRWHMTSLRNNLGFFLFHWHVTSAFKKCHADQIWPGGVQPFLSADWDQFDWPYDLSSNVTAGDFDSLSAFSLAVERWHNEAHMAVETATGQNMMDPATNIFLRDFWRLHYFIDARFLEALATFDGKGPVTQQISNLERNHHLRLGNI